MSRGPRQCNVSSTLLRPIGLLGLAASLILGGSDARAQSSVTATTHTLGIASEVPLSPDASDTRSRVTFYQFLEVATEDTGVEGLQIDLSGFAGVDVADRLFNGIDDEGRVHANLITGLVRWHDRKQRFSASLGRQYLSLGTGRMEHLDGATVTYRLPWDLDLTAFGGRTEPWQLDYGIPSTLPSAPNVSEEPFTYSNWAVGGRARVSLLDIGVASVAFLHEGHGDAVVRQNLAFQAGLWSKSWLEGLGGGVFDTKEGRPQELWLMINSRWWRRVKLTADYHYMVPSLTLSRTSIFSVFSYQEYHNATLGGTWAVTDRLSLTVGGGVRVYPGEDQTDVGGTASLDARLMVGPEANGSVGLRSEYVDSSSQRFVQNRLYGSYRFRCGAQASAEGYALVLGADRGQNTGSDFERRIDRKPYSLGAIGTAAYPITRTLSAALSGSAFVTPLAEHDLRLLARLTYQGFWSWAQ